jgi:hypothetical protein
MVVIVVERGSPAPAYLPPGVWGGKRRPGDLLGVFTFSHPSRLLLAAEAFS